MTIIFHLKDGSEIEMKCKEFSVSRDKYGELNSWEAKGITENQPVYLPIEMIAYIYRKVSDEHDSDK